MKRQDCEEVSINELGCYGLPWYDATKDDQVRETPALFDLQAHGINFLIKRIL